MLTRLKVNGFKNLVDVDLRFGPFTCITGASGVGKSNLFDAISFLGALADGTLTDAAKSVRGEGGRASEIRNLFQHVVDNYARVMTFEAEMIIPEAGFDDLGMEVKAKITYLRYRLAIGLNYDTISGFAGLDLLHEELSHINLGSAAQNLLFPHKAAAWRYSAVKGRRSGGAFISTQGEGKNRIIELHADGEGGGRPRTILACNLQRTVLSTVNTAENPTVLMAKREMQSWRQFRLEPASLRKPDELTAPTMIGPDGAHLAAALYHLRKQEKGGNRMTSESDPDEADSPTLYTRLARILADFGDEMQEISVDHDDKREILTIIGTAVDGTPFSARALSDGSLRFLALSVLALDRQSPGLFCIEEPENGISPDRIPLMLSLLQTIVTDVNRPVGSDNPLRQVIINSHSPAVLASIADESILVADSVEKMRDGAIFKSVRFSCLPDTWRLKTAGNQNTVERDRLLPPVVTFSQESIEQGNKLGRKKLCKETDRSDEVGEQIQPSLPYGEER